MANDPHNWIVRSNGTQTRPVRRSPSPNPSPRGRGIIGARRVTRIALAVFIHVTTCTFHATLADDPQRNNVKSFGAKGDGETDDTAAFTKALAAGGDLYVPAGTYRINHMKLAGDTFLHGAGRATRIVTTGQTTNPITIAGSRCRIADLSITGPPKFAEEGAVATDKGLIFVAPTQKDVSIDNVRVEDHLHNAILAENTDGIRITNCHFEKVGTAVRLVWVKRAQVSNNRVLRTKAEGMQFWGNAGDDQQEMFRTMVCEDLIFANNYVRDCGNALIWGTGARRVVMIGNVVDGAFDVGLDLEWCHDATIVGNTVRNVENAGISLFLSCRNVTISGNSIVIPTGRKGRRDGIWLTGTNKKLFKEDEGHRFIAISGNTIFAEGPHARHGICIDSGERVVCTGNAMHNADLFDRTGLNVRPARRRLLRRTTTVVPFSQQWRFRTDPEDAGMSEQWFAPDHDDGNWSTLRSDRGDGWESQGFENYTGHAWYRAKLPALVAQPRPKIYLHFEGVDEQAWLYLNGHPIGEHTIESTGRDPTHLFSAPFRVEVSKHLRDVAPNVLAVRVHNAAGMGGIWQPVYVVLSDGEASVMDLHDAVVTGERPTEE